MPAGTEDYTQVAPNSTGNKIRNLDVVTLVSGVPTTVQMQVISVADSYGNTIDAENFAEASQFGMQTQLLRRICGALEELAGGVFVANLDDMELELEPGT